MRRAIAWLLSALVTVGSLLLAHWGAFPEVQWPLLALCGFLAFVLVSYRTIAGLEAELDAKPFIRVDASDNERNNRIIEIVEPDPVTRHMVHSHDAFFKLVTVHSTSYAKGCVVRVNDLRQNGATCPGFVPSALRWFGRDGEGAEYKTFVGRDFVLLLYRRPDRHEWQLQAPAREGHAARFWYEPGEYEVELIVSAENTLRNQVVSGLLRVGPQVDDVKFFRTT